MKHKHLYRYYEISQDLINFLRKEEKYRTYSHTRDNQVYSHYGQIKKHGDKYIGIIIEFQNDKFFAPITHDGDKNWLSRGECCDFEAIYDGFNKYAGSVLLCKALPLTKNLVSHLPLRTIFETEGVQYGKLCNDELEYLNSIEVHPRLQDKMQMCIYGHQTSCMQFRIDYQLAAKNVAEYNQLKQSAK